MFSIDVRNDFTRFLDEYRIDSIMNLESPYKEIMSTYLWGDDVSSDEYENDVKYIAFRLTGATRGHITVDRDNIIKDIVFYSETCFDKSKNGIRCYKPEVVVDATKKFRDTKLNLDDAVYGDNYLKEID